MHLSKVTIFTHFAVIIDIWDNDCIMIFKKIKKIKLVDVMCGLRAHSITVGVTTVNQCCLTNTFFYFRQDKINCLIKRWW